jgi:hypothetical protein
MPVGPKDRGRGLRQASEFVCAKPVETAVPAAAARVVHDINAPPDERGRVFRAELVGDEFVSHPLRIAPECAVFAHRRGIGLRLRDYLGKCQTRLAGMASSAVTHMTIIRQPAPWPPPRLAPTPRPDPLHLAEAPWPRKLSHPVGRWCLDVETDP